MVVILKLMLMLLMLMMVMIMMMIMMMMMMTTTMAAFSFFSAVQRRVRLNSEEAVPDGPCMQHGTADTRTLVQESDVGDRVPLQDLLQPCCMCVAAMRLPCKACVLAAK